jgi:hypothetical protein
MSGMMKGDALYIPLWSRDGGTTNGSFVPYNLRFRKGAESLSLFRALGVCVALTMVRSKHFGRRSVRLNSSSLKKPSTLTRSATERTVEIVRHAMHPPKEQKSLPVHDSGSAFSTSEKIVLDERAWDQFVAALESPAREIPPLVELFRAKAPWD